MLASNASDESADSFALELQDFVMQYTEEQNDVNLLKKLLVTLRDSCSLKDDVIQQLSNMYSAEVSRKEELQRMTSIAQSNNHHLREALTEARLAENLQQAQGEVQRLNKVVQRLHDTESAQDAREVRKARRAKKYSDKLQVEYETAQRQLNEQLQKEARLDSVLSKVQSLVNTPVGAPPPMRQEAELAIGQGQRPLDSKTTSPTAQANRNRIIHP